MPTGQVKSVHEAKAAEAAAYWNMFDSMRHGFGGTFDALADYRAKAR